MIARRNVLIGCSAGRGPLPRWPRRERARERSRTPRPSGRAGAAVRSRSVVAEAAAEPLGARPGDRRRRSTRRITSGSSIATTCSAPTKPPPSQNPPTASCC